MYAGYCGTLMTPMAANFNIVPAALLELKDKYQVIKVQFLRQEYPNYAIHLMNSREDLQYPRQLHSIFMAVLLALQ